MSSLLKNTKVLGGAVAVLVILLGWYYWSSLSGGGGGSSVMQVAPASAASPDLLNLLSSLHSIKLDPSIFSDPNFTALSDFGVTIPDEAAGRPNPFAPVGSQVSLPSSQPSAGH